MWSIQYGYLHTKKGINHFLYAVPEIWEFVRCLIGMVCQFMITVVLIKIKLVLSVDIRIFLVNFMDWVLGTSSARVIVRIYSYLFLFYTDLAVFQRRHRAPVVKPACFTAVPYRFYSFTHDPMAVINTQRSPANFNGFSCPVQLGTRSA